MIVHITSGAIVCSSFAAGVIVGMIVVLAIFMLAFRDEPKPKLTDGWGSGGDNPPSGGSAITTSDLTGANKCHHGSTYYKELRDCDLDPKADLYPYIFQCDGCNKWYVPVFPHPAISGPTAKDLGGFPQVQSAITDPALMFHSQHQVAVRRNCCKSRTNRPHSSDCAVSKYGGVVG